MIIAPRRKNTAPIIITGRAPNLSVAIPVNGAKNAPVRLAIEYPKVIAVKDHPISVCKGTINTPKACLIDPPVMCIKAAINMIIQA